MKWFTSVSFLRRVLIIDAASSGLMGLALILFPDHLARMLELPAQLMSETGTILLPFAAFLAFLATRAEPARPAVWMVIALNMLWAVGSIALPVTAWVVPNAAGYAFIIGQAFAVAVLGELEYVGLRKAVALAG